MLSSVLTVPSLLTILPARAFGYALLHRFLPRKGVIRDGEFGFPQSPDFVAALRGFGALS